MADPASVAAGSSSSRSLDESTDVRWHGRGGQGVVVLSQIAGTAAFLADRHVQVFPEFGVERRGAPVRAFLRIAAAPIRIRSAIQRPQVIVVLDPILLSQEDTWNGTGAATTVLFNARGRRWDLPDALGAAWAVDATAIAGRQGLGTATTPIVNTAMAGAFAKATGLVTLEHVVEAVRRLSPAKPDENVRAAEDAYREVEPWE